MKKINRPTFFYLDWWADDYCFRFVILIVTAIAFPTMLYYLSDTLSESNFPFLVSIIVILGSSFSLGGILATIYEVIVVSILRIYKNKSK